MATITSQNSQEAVKYQVLLDTLAAAFFDDPVHKWLLPQDEERRAHLPKRFRVFLDHALEYGEVATAAGGNACILYYPPGGYEKDSSGFVHRIRYSLGPHGSRAITLNAVEQSSHPHGKDHLYVPYLAVRPCHQRRGLGTVLLRDVLAEARSKELPLYLEATTESNRKLYARLGGRRLGFDIAIPGGPTMWPMWFDPDSARRD